MSAVSKPLIQMDGNERGELIVELVRDLFVTPRKAISKWAHITGQTSQIRLAYPGQHLASVVTGVPGSGSAARGDDLMDGTEVKSCSRVDQLGNCKECKDRVPSYAQSCPNCGSTQIDRKTDSHWIFAIKSSDELNGLLSLPRILLVLFDGDDAGGVRVRIWRISPQNPYVRNFFEDYYANNYTVKFERRGNPAPCNLHPLKYDFYLMSPCLILEIQIESDDIRICFLDVENNNPEPIPTTILQRGEITKLASELEGFAGTPKSSLAKEFRQKYPFVPDGCRESLSMRPKRPKTI